jgi:hypothetical protein
MKPAEGYEITVSFGPKLSGLKGSPAGEFCAAAAEASNPSRRIQERREDVRDVRMTGLLRGLYTPAGARGPKTKSTPAQGVLARASAENEARGDPLTPPAARFARCGLRPRPALR